MGRQQRVVVGGQATQQLQGPQQHLQGMPQEEQLQGQQSMPLQEHLQGRGLQEQELQEEQH